MSLFQCEKCGVIENTSTGHYWNRDSKYLRDIMGDDFGKALCSECGPEKKWHDYFEKQFYPVGTMETDPDTGNIREKK